MAPRCRLTKLLTQRPADINMLTYSRHMNEITQRKAAVIKLLMTPKTINRGTLRIKELSFPRFTLVFVFDVSILSARNLH